MVRGVRWGFLPNGRPVGSHTSSGCHRQIRPLSNLEPCLALNLARWLVLLAGWVSRAVSEGGGRTGRPGVRN